MQRGAGRFAPSPTGPLHLGSLLAATAAWLDARARGDAWYVRLDDLDIQRNRPGATAAILAALDAHALRRDGPVRYQHDRIPDYEAALTVLADQGRLFYCRCSRKDLQGLTVYPGTCRARTQPADGCAIRFRVVEPAVEFDDLIQGRQSEPVQRTVGDFVVRRRDGIFAYALATAVDDGADEITRVIRGRDLLQHTAAQLLVMDALGLQRPCYAHLPLIVNAAGQKLSKQTHAPALDLARPLDNLRAVLAALGSPAADAAVDTCTALLEAARSCWSLDHIPRQDRSTTYLQEPS
jgi:glutamyl-Q tRNA(Asp) synthetase